MSSKLTSTARGYFCGSLIMFVGLIYNLIEQDLIGSAVFLLFAVIFLSKGLLKSKASSNNAA